MNFETMMIREPSISMNQLKRMDEKYYFYYDESNNFRKVRLRESELNIEIDSNFVLGGVVHEEHAIDYDIIGLYNALKLQKSVNELKLKHIAKGDFLDMLKSQKLNIFLKWLYESDLYIHYLVLNLLYFSLVDIVDSCVVNSEIGSSMTREFIDTMKSNLYTIAKRDEENFLSILYKYEYPNIKKEELKLFIKDLIEYIRVYEDEAELHIGLVSLRGFLKESISKNELAFIENNRDHELIEDFVHFYANPIYMFINSIHEFDEESSVFEVIDDMNMTFNGMPIKNYKQSNSKDNKLVQISDVTVGIIAKFVDFVVSTNFNELPSIIEGLNELEKNSFDLLKKLVNKSNEFNIALLHFSMSHEDRRKLGLLGC